MTFQAGDRVRLAGLVPMIDTHLQEKVMNQVGTVQDDEPQNFDSDYPEARGGLAVYVRFDNAEWWCYVDTLEPETEQLSDVEREILEG